MTDTFEIKKFRDIPLTDPFFNSLKKDYSEFPVWYNKKALQNTVAYVQYTDTVLTGFMYLKLEDGPINDIKPPLASKKRLKIGTLKVEAHGTRLGERLLKKAFDNAIYHQVDEIYLTIFPHHQPLIKMLQEFGFVDKGNTKTTKNGTEIVLIKNLTPQSLTGNLRWDYPIIDTRNVDYYLLAVKPQWHSKLFPDSLLRTENYDLLSDISYTNSVCKNYICSMDDVNKLKPKDLLITYRTNDYQGSAEYRSVATSVCTVEEIRAKNSFRDINEYIQYNKQYSVFNDEELASWWSRRNLYIIKMLYSAAFTKRVIRKTLAEKIGLDRNERWGFLKLSREQFLKIIEFGGIDVRFVVR